MALPIGDVRDPVDIPLDPDGAVVIDHIKVRCRPHAVVAAICWCPSPRTLIDAPASRNHQAIIGGTEKFELLLAGVAMACLFLVCCVCMMHYRLRQVPWVVVGRDVGVSPPYTTRHPPTTHSPKLLSPTCSWTHSQEHAALEKDKIMGGSLRRMWNRFMKQERLKNAQRYSKVELSEEGGGEAGGAAGAGGKVRLSLLLRPVTAKASLTVLPCTCCSKGACSLLGGRGRRRRTRRRGRDRYDLRPCPYRRVRGGGQVV